MSEFTMTNRDERGTLYDQIHRMRQRPAMWLGEATLTAMWRFTDAYQFALRQHGIDENLDPPFDEFNDFCARYFQVAAEVGWCRIIVANHCGQEDEALGHFFALFDQFRDRVDVMKGRRTVTAFAREVTFNQSHWRASVADFDAVPSLCGQSLCDAYHARVAHEYDAALRAIEMIALNNASVKLVLGHASVIAGRAGART
jgi:hypothetical protein